MMQAQKIMVMKAIAALAAVPGVGYRVEIPGGDGETEVLTNFSERVTKRRPRNSYRKHYLPALRNLENYCAVKIAIPEDADPVGFAGAIASWCHRTWGPDSASQHKDEENRFIEVARHDGGFNFTVPQQGALIDNNNIGVAL